MPSEAALADLRAALDEERAQLRHQLADLGFGDDGGLAYDQNFADSSQVTAERGEAEALANSLKETLAEVEHALAKFEAGTYGLCENCGEPIPPARLEAKPAARLCINCASRR
ncbi:MAG: TraR/DksA family transcriptional regulator [Actinobacteria bacterium]|jgi:DnaK suppressor protein|nr:MAG: TraR/DksA family transcriptional regulator [Actinomycetota bacterium]